MYERQYACLSASASRKRVTQARVCEAADIWLRKAAKVDACAIKALSFPNKSEETRIGKLVRMAGVIYVRRTFVVLFSED